MTKSTSPAAGKLTRLALIGFVVGSLQERSARAHFPAYMIEVSLVGTGVTTAVGAVLLVVTLVKQHDNPQADGELARRLIDSALVTQQGDLGMQVQLLVESPAAFAQLDRELGAGQGPALDAMLRATGLPVERLQAAWSAAKLPVGAVESPELASHVVFAFLVDVAPELEVSRQQASELAWNLARERSSPSFPERARHHQWLADWLGVPVEAVGDATQVALASLPTVADLEPRPFIHANPDVFLNALAASIEREQSAALNARAAAISQEAGAVLPPQLRDSMVVAATR